MTQTSSSLRFLASQHRTPQHCAFGGRECAAALSAILLDEYVDVATRMQARFSNVNPTGALAWLRAKCLWVEPAPLGKRRSRDAEDDPVLATALAARARYIIASDRDLLDLEKPFGIEIVTPAEFLRQFQS